MPADVLSPAAVAWLNTSVLSWMRERLLDAGGRRESIPDEPVAYWRLPEVRQRTGLARSTIYAKVKSQTFPAPIAIGERRVRRDP